MSDLLTAAQVQTRLAEHPGWRMAGDVLERDFDRTDFNGSIAFVNAIAATANGLDHHPDIALAWNIVTVRTSSHDVNGISARDFALIAKIDAL